jgi:hypothetical protein
MTDIKLHVDVVGDGAIVEGIVLKLPNTFMPEQELFEASNRVLLQRLRVNSSKWILIGLVTAALILAAMSMHSFLAVNNPIGEGILVVEGWIPVPALAESLKAFDSGHYRYVAVVGGPIPGDDGNSENLRTYDDLAAKRLEKLGFDMKKLVKLNVPAASAGDRTIASVTAVKRWLSDSKISVCCVDVFTSGVHARKSLILFRHALGDRYRVGVSTASNVSYDPRRWFFSARGIWLVARNLAGYVYAKFWILFHGQGSTYLINVNNFGATGNGTTDDTAAINSAIAALQPGYQLFFPCGTYLISSGLNAIVINNVTVYGQTGCSAGPVTLRSTGSGSTLLQVGYGPWLSGSTPITATTADMDTTFQANFSGAGVGDYVYLEESVSNSDTNHTNCGGSGCRGEVLKITGLSGNTATVETALHHAYDTSCCVPWVQKMLNPVSGVSVHDLVLDGSGVAIYGLTVLDAVNTTVTNLTAQNVAWSGVAGWNGYNNTYKNIAVTHAGMINGGTVGGAAMTLTQQGNLNVDSVSVSNMNAPAFGFNIIKEANGNFSNISIDATGTGSGRPLKLNSAAHNTLNNVSVNRSEGAYYNGITIEYFSHHNVWNSCKVTNSINYNNPGIVLYGDQANGNHEGSNHYNTFNNCTVTRNAGYAVWVLDNNNQIEINGGTYSGLAGQYVLAFDDSAPCCTNNAYIHNATINGPGSIGIWIANGSASACINNNTFGPGLTAAINVTAPSDIGSANILNGLVSNLIPGTC